MNTKNKILIITHTEDNNCVELVTEALEQLGAEVVRFDIDKYPLETSLTSEFFENEWHTHLTEGDKKHRIDDITALWFRRAYNLGRGLSGEIDKKFLGAALGELRQTLFGMTESMPCYHFGKMSQYRRMDSKEEQLKVANHLGLKIPQTCITNDPQTAKEFVKKCKDGAIAKMQSGFAIYEEGVEHVVFTNIVDENTLEEIDTLRYCPMQFQELIPKEKELRVTIVGDKVFSFEIDSQKIENAKVDWRKEGVELIEDWKPHTLPEEIENKLLALMDFYGIDYGAIDLILTPEQQYYFLEVNAAGEFFWIDRLCDGAISKQIAEVLNGTAKRRGKVLY